MRFVAFVALVGLCSCIDDTIDDAPFEVVSDTVADSAADFDSVDADETKSDSAMESDPEGDSTVDTTDVYVPPKFGPEAAAVTIKLAAAARWSAALDGVAGDVLIAADELGWTWVDAEGARPILDLDGIAVLTTPVGVVSYNDETSLISDGTRLWTLTGGVLSATPLADLFDGRVIAAMVRRTDGAIWFSTDGPLYRLEDDVISIIAPTGLATQDGILADGASVDGTQALWVASGWGVYALTEADDALKAWPEQPDLMANALAGDAGDNVWAAIDGALWRRRLEQDDDAPAQAFWGVLDVGQPVRTVLSARTSPDAWFVAEGGTLFHHVGRTITEVTNAPAFAVDTHFSVDRAGRLLAAGPDGVVEIAAGRVLNLLGINPGSRVDDPTVVTVRASSPAEVSAVTAQIDGMTVTAVPVADGADGMTWDVILDPEPLTTGDHVLAVSVTYGAVETIATTLAFTVLHITWDDHIQPLYQRRCSACHNDVDGASTAIMTSLDAWRSRYPCILCRVTNPFNSSLAECVLCEDVPSSMPPTGPISRAEVELIERWGQDGFREGIP